MANAPTTNAPVNLADVSKFLGETARGFAKNCRFAITLTPPPIFFGRAQRLGFISQLSTAKELTFLCDSTEITGRNFNTVDTRYYGPSFKLPFQSLYNDVNFSFLCRNEMREKRFFDYWHNKINPNSSYDFSYVDDYGAVINVYAFNEEGTAMYQQTLIRAWPILVGPIQTTWADDQISRLNVTFTFREYKTKEDPTPMPALETLVLNSTSLEDGTFFLGDASLT